MRTAPRRSVRLLGSSVACCSNRERGASAYLCTKDLSRVCHGRRYSKRNVTAVEITAEATRMHRFDTINLTFFGQSHENANEQILAEGKSEVSQRNDAIRRDALNSVVFPVIFSTFVFKIWLVKILSSLPESYAQVVRTTYSLCRGLPQHHHGRLRCCTW